MTDFEERLSRALRGAADRAPEPGDLSPRHRHRTAVLLAVAAVLVAVAVPVGIIRYVSGPGSGGSSVATQSPSGTTATASVIPAGWRAETFHDVTFLVPDTWGYGSLVRCGEGSATSPVVDLPFGTSDAVGVGCSPQTLGYGVAIRPSGSTGDDYARMSRPTGSAFRQIDKDGVTLYILAPDPATADQIAASAHVVDGVDPNGCAVDVTYPDLGAFRPAQGDSGSLIALCRYSIVDGTPWLLQSELLDETQGAKARTALAAAPPMAPASPSLSPCPVQEEFATYDQSGAPFALVHYGFCSQGLDLGNGDVRALTSQVMFWTLMPGWSGGLPGSIPMPTPLRTFSAPQPTSLEPPSGAPAGWRVESWHHVTLLVPDSWGHGDIEGCWEDGGPRVERPEGFKRACLRTGWGYGVAFFPPGTDLTVDPVDRQAYSQVVSVGQAEVAIVTPDKATGQQIAASIRVYQGQDPNGCPARVNAPSLGAASPGAFADFEVGSASVCWYGVTNTTSGQLQGELLDSERLSEGQTGRAIAALTSAPAGTTDPLTGSCLSSGSKEQYFGLILYYGQHVWVHYDGCTAHGIDGAGPTKQLTEQVMYWALLPGWTGAVGAEVPLPARLRGP